ncbi:MAG: NAD-dependent DNA ligase LigA [Kiritimatiellae bacterium]|nr:NAD-dependent DNA ligase LigA [Kiritimatiellia bacterium]
MKDNLISDAGSSAEIRIRQLVSSLNAAADSYYNGRGEVMSDYEWDKGFDELKRLEQETGFFLPDSPTRNVSADNTAGQKEAHEFDALSLAKTKSVADVAEWAEGKPVWISWKLDGLTLVATYDGGRLVKIVTRGDGHVGTNITRLAPAIGRLPLQISHKGHLVVRGEAIISYHDFNEFLAQSQEPYANPRNLASGSLSLKDVEEVKNRKIVWRPFALVSGLGDAESASWGKGMDALDSLGFYTVERELVEVSDFSHLNAVIESWTRKVTECKCPYPVDGLVIAYEDSVYARSGSVTGHHAVRGGLAFKWADVTARTELERIDWSCAVGSICPVAVFRPVELEGTTVRRASLVNISECERLGIGGKGTLLDVIKSNKIIPKVVAVAAKNGDFEIPVSCPVCTAPTRIEIAESGTKKLVCSNPDCAARTLRKFMRFVSKEGMDIDGLAGETIARFLREGLIKSVADIYRLDSRRDEIAALEGFGAKSADKIAAAIADARSSRKPEQLVVALSIPMCGTESARLLLSAFPDPKTLFAVAATAENTDVFTSIRGIGPQVAKCFIDWCHDPGNRETVAFLLDEVSFDPFKAAVTTGTCQGKTFLATGSLKEDGKFKTRKALKDYVLSQGGKWAASVSKSVDFLVNNDISSNSSKNKAAKELGIPIITEDEFVATYWHDGNTTT